MAHAPCSACGSTQGPDHLCPGDTASLVGQVLDGRYQIDGVLGQGGMGMVFSGIQTSVQRPVAVKTLHSSLAAAPQFYERFRREAEVASRLRHPNVITVFDFGRTTNGICYFVMELLDGESLRQLVRRDGPLSIRRAVSLIEQAARGLGHAHHQACVHRDLKPHNIMIQNLDGQEFVKVLDFGLVKAMEQEEEEQLTSTGQVLGTPQYMPPEQAGGEMVDQRSDLYSLGGVLYFCLTGTSPFQANTVRKALTAALTKTVPPVATYRVGAPVPEALDAFFRKALSREKEDRFQSTDEFIAEMRAAIEGLSDEVLDALPEIPPEGALSSQRGGGSHSGVNKTSGGGKAKGGKTPSSPSRASKRASSKVVVDPALAGGAGGTISASSHRRETEDMPSLAKQGGSARTGAIAAAALLVLALGGGGAYVALKPKPMALPPGTTSSSAKPTTPDKPPAAVLTSVKPESLPAEEVTTEVSVTFESEPAAAEVIEDGILLGRTPLVRKWPRNELKTVTFKLAGHADERRSFRFDRDDTVRVQLETLTASKPTGSARTGRNKKNNSSIPVFE